MAHEVDLSSSPLLRMGHIRLERIFPGVRVQRISPIDQPEQRTPSGSSAWGVFYRLCDSLRKVICWTLKTWRYIREDSRRLQNSFVFRQKDCSSSPTAELQNWVALHASAHSGLSSRNAHTEWLRPTYGGDQYVKTERLYVLLVRNTTPRGQRPSGPEPSSSQTCTSSAIKPQSRTRAEGQGCGVLTSEHR